MSTRPQVPCGDVVVRKQENDWREGVTWFGVHEVGAKRLHKVQTIHSTARQSAPTHGRQAPGQYVFTWLGGLAALHRASRPFSCPTEGSAPPLLDAKQADASERTHNMPYPDEGGDAGVPAVCLRNAAAPPERPHPGRSTARARLPGFVLDAVQCDSHPCDPLRVGVPVWTPSPRHACQTCMCVPMAPDAGAAVTKTMACTSPKQTRCGLPRVLHFTLIRTQGTWRQ